MRRLKVLLIGIMLYSANFLAASPESKIDQIQNSCSSQAFTSLVDTAEIQTQAGNYKEALAAYRKAYGICPMKDLEEQMAWLMGEVGNE